MGYFDFTKPFSQEFRTRLSGMQEKIVELEKIVGDLSGEISSIGPPAPLPFWAILRCARPSEGHENQWEYGWEEFHPYDVHDIAYDVRVDGAATAELMEGELRSSQLSADKPKPPGPKGPKKPDYRFEVSACNLLELDFPEIIAPLSDEDQSIVLSHGERTGEFAGSEISLVSCGWLAEAESCQAEIDACRKEKGCGGEGDKKGIPQCVKSYSMPIVRMYEGQYYDASWTQRGGKTLFFALPNSVKAVCK